MKEVALDTIVCFWLRLTRNLRHKGRLKSHEHQGNSAVLLTRWPHSDFNVLPKGSQKVHQSLDGEVAGLPTHQTGNVWLFNAQYRSSLCLREASILDKPVDLQCKAGFELLTFRVGKAEVGKDVAATAPYPDSVAFLHVSVAFLCGPALPPRAVV